MNEIMSAGLFLQLLGCALAMSVHMLEIYSNRNYDVSFFISIVGIATIIIATYIYCYLSEFFTHELCMIGDHFYNCDWYRLPIKQQQMFIMPIQRAQVEFRMTGLGIIECSLRVFSSVSYRYFESEIVSFSFLSRAFFP